MVIKFLNDVDAEGNTFTKDQEVNVLGIEERDEKLVLKTEDGQEVEVEKSDVELVPFDAASPADVDSEVPGEETPAEMDAAQGDVEPATDTEDAVQDAEVAPETDTETEIEPDAAEGAEDMEDSEEDEKEDALQVNESVVNFYNSLMKSNYIKAKENLHYVIKEKMEARKQAKMQEIKASLLKK